MKEFEWVSPALRPMLTRERRQLGRLRGKTVADVHLDYHMDRLDVTCTDGSAFRIAARVTNDRSVLISIRPFRKRKHA
jgi:hypothetical protein